MRIVLTIAVAILASTGFAQTSATNADPSSALTPEAIAIQWEKLMIVTSGETEAEAIENLRAHGLSKEGALALMVFRAASLRRRIVCSHPWIRSGSSIFTPAVTGRRWVSPT